MEEYYWISKMVQDPALADLWKLLDRLGSNYGVKITIAGPTDMADAPYLEAIHNAVKSRAAGIMVTGWGTPGTAEAIDAAVDKGIPVVTVDSDVPNSKRLAHVGADWFDMGQSMAQKLAELIGGRGKVLVIGMPGPANMMAGYRGFFAQVKEHPNIQVFGPEDDTDTGYGKAQSIVADYLSRHGDLSGVVGFDNRSGPGAAAAIEQAGKAKAVKLICVDIDPPHLEHVRRGTISVAFGRKRRVLTCIGLQLLYDFNHGTAVTGWRGGLINIPGNIETGYVQVALDNIGSFATELDILEFLDRHELGQRVGLLSSMVQNMAEIALAADSQEHVIYANPAALRLGGYTEDQIRGMALRDLFRLGEDHAASVRECLTEGRAASFETLAVKKDGSTFPVLLSLSALASDKAVRGLSIVARDLTARKRGQEALERSESWLHLIMQNTHDGIDVCTYDPDVQERKLLFCNDRFVEMSGYSRQDLMSVRNLDDFVRNVQPVPDFRKRIKAGMVCHGLDTWVRPDGKENYFEWTVSPLTVDGKLHTIGVDRDVTERIKAERELAEYQRRLELIMQNSSDGINITMRDPETRQRRLVMCNDRFVEMSGRSREELMAADDLNSLTTLIKMGKDIPQPVGAGTYRHGASSWNRPDGRENYYEWTACQLTIDGVQYNVGIDRDITGRIEAERKLRKSQEVERAFRENLQALHEVTVELGQTPSVRDLCRRAVELGHSPLGFDRLGIWLADENEPGMFKGTYGTDEKGHLREEWDRRVSLGLLETFQVTPFKLPWLVKEDQVLLDDFGRPVGKGTRVTAPLEDGQKIIGYVATDNLLRKEPITEQQAEVLRLFASALGHLYNQKTAEDALHKSEEDYRLLVENQSDMVIKLDAEGGFLFASPSFCKTFGMEESKLLGHRVPLSHNQDDRGEIAEAANSLRRPPYVARLQVRLKTVDGLRWLSWVGNGILDENGHLKAIVAVGRDVTQRVEAEEKLKANQEAERTFGEKLQALLDINKELDRATNTKELCRLTVELGRSRLGFDRLGVWFIPPDNPNVLKGSFGTDDKGQLREEWDWSLEVDKDAPIMHPVSGQTPVVVYEGELAEHESSVPGKVTRMSVPLYDGERIMGVLGMDNLLTKRPVTKQQAELLRLFATNVGLQFSRKRTEQELRRSEESYRLLVENQSDIVVRFDAAWRLDFVSQSFYRLFAKTEDELRGQKLFAQIDQTGWPDEAQLAEKLLHPPHSCYFEHRVMTKAGWRWLAWVINAVRGGGGSVQAFIGVGRDVTERKRLEEQLIQAQKMEAIGRLAGGIAHDFNNQLTVIKGYSELLLKELSADNSLYGPIEEIYKASERASSLTGQLLTFSRKQILRPKTINLNDILAEMADPLKRMAGENVQLSILPAPDLDNVKADPMQVNQAIINLIVNAQDAMPEGGRLTIETRNATLDDDYVSKHIDATVGPHVVLAISDTGTGIDADVLPRIFDPFFTTKPMGQGTGLGLPMVYGFVTQSGGHITVTTKPGQGSTFCIYLPRVEAEAKAKESSTDKKAAPKRCQTILVCEDDAAIRNLIVKLLRDNGYRVLEAANAHEAIEHCQQHSDEISLLVTDVVMPGMSGTELVGKFRDVHQDVLVLYITGYAGQSKLRQQLTDDRNRILVKPFGPRKLLQAIRSLLNEPSPPKR